MRRKIFAFAIFALFLTFTAPSVSAQNHFDVVFLEIENGENGVDKLDRLGQKDGYYVDNDDKPSDTSCQGPRTPSECGNDDETWFEYGEEVHDKCLIHFREKDRNNDNDHYVREAAPGSLISQNGNRIDSTRWKGHDNEDHGRTAYFQNLRRSTGFSDFNTEEIDTRDAPSWFDGSVHEFENDLLCHNRNFGEIGGNNDGGNWYPCNEDVEGRELVEGLEEGVDVGGGKLFKCEDSEWNKVNEDEFLVQYPNRHPDACTGFKSDYLDISELDASDIEMTNGHIDFEDDRTCITTDAQGTAAPTETLTIGELDYQIEVDTGNTPNLACDEEVSEGGEIECRLENYGEDVIWDVTEGEIEENNEHSATYTAPEDKENIENEDNQVEIEAFEEENQGGGCGIVCPYALNPLSGDRVSEGDLIDDFTVTVTEGNEKVEKGTIEFRVEDVDGNKLEGVYVEVVNGNGISSSTSGQTNSNGIFEVEKVPPGDYTVGTTAKDGYVTATNEKEEISREITINEGQDKTEEVTLKEDDGEESDPEDEEESDENEIVISHVDIPAQAERGEEIEVNVTLEKNVDSISAENIELGVSHGPSQSSGADAPESAYNNVAVNKDDLDLKKEYNLPIRIQDRVLADYEDIEVIVKSTEEDQPMKNEEGYPIRTERQFETVGSDEDDDDSDEEDEDDSDSGGNEEPAASYDFNPGTPEVGDTVTFDGSSSSDPDGRITSYEWDWTGDGTFEESGETASNSFSSSGNYDVALKVTDNKGETSTYSETISINSNDEDEPDETEKSELTVIVQWDERPADETVYIDGAEVVVACGGSTYTGTTNVGNTKLNVEGQDCTIKASKDGVAAGDFVSNPSGQVTITLDYSSTETGDNGEDGSDGDDDDENQNEDESVSWSFVSFDSSVAKTKFSQCGTTIAYKEGTGPDAVALNTEGQEFSGTLEAGSYFIKKTQTCDLSFSDNNYPAGEINLEAGEFKVVEMKKAMEKTSIQCGNSVAYSVRESGNLGGEALTGTGTLEKGVYYVKADESCTLNLPEVSVQAASFCSDKSDFAGASRDCTDQESLLQGGIQGETFYPDFCDEGKAVVCEPEEPSCQEIVENAQTQYESDPGEGRPDIACTQETAEMVCPSDEEFTYTAVDGCEINYLESRGWTRADSSQENNVINQASEFCQEEGFSDVAEEEDGETYACVDSAPADIHQFENLDFCESDSEVVACE